MSRPKNILITGSNGFVGKALYLELKNLGYKLKGSVRNNSKFIPGQSNVTVGLLNSETNWEEALHGCSIIIHLAGRAHILNDTSEDPYYEFNSINTEGTINLAKQAAKNGVKRFIFVSSIGVNGPKSEEMAITAQTAINPHTPYAKSKVEAEIALQKISTESNMELVIIRPPAIYGKGAPGNFGLIEKFVKKGLPLPLGSIKNRRSLVYLHNLTSFIAVCVENKQAAEKVFVIDDNEDLSTPEIVLLIASLSKRKARIINFPNFFLSFILKVIGKNKIKESLMDNLQIDSSATRDITGWEPPFNPRELFLQSHLTNNLKEDL